MLTQEELKNATTLIEVGAKAIIAEKPVRESLTILQMTVDLLTKLESQQDEKPARVKKAN